MTDGARTPRQSFRLGTWFRVQDFAWLCFIVALIAFTPETNYDLPIVLVLLGAFQIAEPRFVFFLSRRGQVVSIILKLILSYLLVGYTHGITSPLDAIFLVPVIFAATTFDWLGVVAVTLIACFAYYSFLLPAFVGNFQLPPDFISLVLLRVSFYAIVAFMVFEQAKAKRNQMERTEEAAAQLAESNRNLRKAEVSLRRNERLAALGQLTAGLAHELRNPLGTIRASAEMLSKQSARNRPEVMAEMADYIRTEADRMSGLIASFLDFARPLQIRPVDADLILVLQQVFREQSNLARERGVALRLDSDEASLHFAFDPDLLRLAISNLLQNAIQASSPGQEVKVSVLPSAGTIRTQVRDHGSGIAPDQLENIFNPFFTTKPSGVGLGLAIVAKIVDEHGGRILVQSDSATGTVFQIVLPREQPT